MNRNKLTMCLAFALTAVVPEWASGATFNVPGDFATIQGCIDAAQNGDECIVAPRTYNELIDFHGKAITLRSSGGAAVTIIDAGPVPDPGTGKPVVRCDSGEGADSVLEGFTVTGGTGATSGPDAPVGGGMFINNSSPTIRDCIFRENIAINGGGMYSIGSTPTVTGCTFSGNSAANGGGMLNDVGSHATVTNCAFTGNRQVAGGGGGGLLNNAGGATLRNCTFSGNTAEAVGGGIDNAQNSTMTMVNCILWGNFATGAGDELLNFNQAASPPTIKNSDIQGSMAGGVWDASLGIDAGGNIDADPLFVDADGPDNIPGNEDDNLRLLAGSPAIDAGDNATVNDCQPDLDGNSRRRDDPATTDSGNGIAPVVDMGAYEFESSPPQDCNGNGIPDECEDVRPSCVLASHIGANDPKTEGWELGVTSPGFVVGPVFSDFGHIPAWNLETTARNADVTYRFLLTDQQIAASLVDGWALTSVIRVLNRATDIGGLILRFSSGEKIFELAPIRNIDTGDLSIFFEGTNVAVEGAADGYHVLHMTDDDANGLVDLYIDGVSVLDNIAIPDFVWEKSLRFGDIVGGTPFKNSNTNYALIRFETNPTDPTHGCTGTVIDCNDNGMLDSCDIRSGISGDCNGNGVPDECDISMGTSVDCNQNTVPDRCDLASGESPDFNTNGIPDECDPDCQPNDIPDFLDIALGLSEDCNLDDVPDDCQLDNNDCNTNDIPDDCESNSDGDGFIDACDNCVFDSNPDQADFDDDGMGDACDPDMDNDGVPNETDACPFTKVGAAVDAEGRSLGDIDKDCDTDLDDYSLFQLGFTGAGSNMP